MTVVEQIKALMDRGIPVVSGAAGRVGHILEVDGRQVYLGPFQAHRRAWRGYKRAVTSFDDADVVLLYRQREHRVTVKDRAFADPDEIQYSQEKIRQFLT